MHKITELLFLVLILSIFIEASSQSKFKKIIHTTDPQAKCLDGSPPLMYISEGSVKDKFILFFVGGGYCAGLTLSQTLQSCYKRSQSQLGSSKYWPDQVPTQVGGYFNNNQSLYANWTRVIFAYCDGAFFQGQAKNQIKYKDASLYFRGAAITRSNFKYLIDNYQMDQATNIILTGGSAGAIAVYLWDEYLRSKVKDPSAVKSIPDSGLFLNTLTHGTNLPLLQITIEILVKLSNIDEKTPITSCNKDHPGQQWKCLLIEYNFPYLTGNFLWINSQYDSYAISVNLMINCLKNGKSGETLAQCSQGQMDGIQKYRTSFLNFVKTMKNQRNSFWLISCSNHVYAIFDDFYDVSQQRVPQNTSFSTRQAIKQFALQGKYVWMIDQKPWPQNAPCAY